MTQQQPIWIEEEEFSPESCALEAEMPHALVHKPFHRRYPLLTAVLTAASAVVFIFGVATAIFVWKNGTDKKELKKKLQKLGLI